MSPFFVYVIVLTIIYVIYFGYTICRDYIGKKGEDKTNTETFSVSGEQSPIEIEEEPETEDDSLAPIEEKLQKKEEKVIADAEKEDSAEAELYNTKTQKMKDQMEKTEPEYGLALDDVHLEEELKNPTHSDKPSIKVQGITN